MLKRVNGVWKDRVHREECFKHKISTCNEFVRGSVALACNTRARRE